MVGGSKPAPATSSPVLSWGRTYRYTHSQSRLRSGQVRIAPEAGKGPAIAHGMGRSYGDTALSDGGTLLMTSTMDRVLSVNWTTGVVRAEAGLTLDALLGMAVPRGWFPAVTPGSKFVTLGGCVANDVHGKNHHNQGSFGTCVRAFQLERSDRVKSVVCTPVRNKALFAATLGGLGLTGVIRWVEIQLKPIRSAYLDVENIPYPDMDAFLRLSEESAGWDYTVAWVDCFAKGRNRGRGIFTRGRFSETGALKLHSAPRLRMNLTPPGFLLNKLSVKTFNRLYRWRPGARYRGKSHYDPFFYPLDGIAEWNRLYGRRGFFQHQCLIPPEEAREGVSRLLSAIERSGQGSFLAVLKRHGREASPGWLSFCGPGLSLALDFANRGQKTKDLLSRLDRIVLDHGGRLYPAKDGSMSAETFKAAFPEWHRVEALRDPALMSAFWSRILKAHTLKAPPDTFSGDP